ncbi:unnamed protein product [Clonostachys chloroleuca]|uniref:Uncharacterized protein n=1 Tax=Clonostachys chloroleuca TaxID=1926264 RepID=A0AA35LVE1_9HYPO|nr:unnamed protein product [Clonostachys chloroleuca]
MPSQVIKQHVGDDVMPDANWTETKYDTLSGAEWDDLAVPQSPISNEPRNLADSTLWHLVERTFLGRYEPLRMQAPCPDKVLTSLPIGEDERAEHAQGRTHTRRHSVRTRPSD